MKNIYLLLIMIFFLGSHTSAQSDSTSVIEGSIKPLFDLNRKGGEVDLVFSGFVKKNYLKADFKIETSDNLSLLSEQSWSKNLVKNTIYKKNIKVIIPENDTTFIRLTIIYHSYLGDKSSLTFLTEEFYLGFITTGDSVELLREEPKDRYKKLRVPSDTVLN